LPGSDKIGVRQVTFALIYDRKQAVTKVDIPAGGFISPENIKIEKISSNVPEPSNWKPPYGLIAKRRLPANTVLRQNMLGPLKSSIIVKRNQNVVIRIEQRISDYGHRKNHAGWQGRRIYQSTKYGFTANNPGQDQRRRQCGTGVIEKTFCNN